MASLASAIIVGNVCRDPETRVTPKGTAICQFSVAVNRKVKGEDKASFFDIEAWDKTAEFVQKYITKGRVVLVQGRLEQDTWEDKTSGQKRSKIKVVAFEVQALDKKPAAPAEDEAPASAVSQGVARGKIEEDSVPF